MKEFLDQDFLLETETAKLLFHKYAENKPIIDFHNHLNPQEIYEDGCFSNLGQAWLAGDHYKWRAMRAAGVPEERVTGAAEDKEKYDSYAAILPQLFGNPQYHWTHLELQRYFGICTPLSVSTADAIYAQATAALQTGDYSVRNLLARMNVKQLCTTDDPADDLHYHQLLQKEESRFFVRPTFRPERAMKIAAPDYPAYLQRLGAAAGLEIHTYQDLKMALAARIRFFRETGCKASDHSLEGCIYAATSEEEAAAAFAKRLAGSPLTKEEETKFRSAVMVFLAKEYHKADWVMQLHIGALRNNSSRRFASLGADCGFDSADDISYAAPLAALLNEADKTNELPKTILYNLNGRDTEMLASMAGNFFDGTTPGKVQLGAAWWFCDTKSGMERQLNAYAESGALAQFVGMVTDSRSFLSFPRHEYFRRILCNWIGNKVENGEYPFDEELLGNLVERISYQNALDFFQMN